MDMTISKVRKDESLLRGGLVFEDPEGGIQIFTHRQGVINPSRHYGRDQTPFVRLCHFFGIFLVFHIMSVVKQLSEQLETWTGCSLSIVI